MHCYWLTSGAGQGNKQSGARQLGILIVCDHGAPAPSITVTHCTFIISSHGHPTRGHVLAQGRCTEEGGRQATLEYNLEDGHVEISQDASSSLLLKGAGVCTLLFLTERSKEGWRLSGLH